MTQPKANIHFAAGSEDLGLRAKTGVSMHCHTEHSKEMLDFIPHYAGKLPVIAHFWRKEALKYCEKNGKEIDFSTAFWAPPLDVDSVYQSEKGQINDRGLNALISITDHDSIDGTVKLNAQNAGLHAPISLEWTVPFDYGFFHLGIHNLPQKQAVELTEALLDYTFTKEEHSNENLRELLATLHSHRGVLVILNHPLWDIEIVGKKMHESLLDNFLLLHGEWIHALEVNGFRSWSENQAVIKLAESLDIPIATGGDRHGCKPNTVFNTTNAATFEEFVDEIRVDKHSEIAVMPAYEHPLASRQLEAFSEILGCYPEFPEPRRRWFDRVFFDIGDEKGLVSLSSHGWKHGGPTWLRGAIWTLGFLGSETMRPFFRLTVSVDDRLPKLADRTASLDSRYDKLQPALSSKTA